MSTAASISATELEAAPAARTRSWFWRYWGGSTVSRVGTAVTTIALPLTALGAAHASSFEVGLIVAADYFGWAVLGLPAGVLVGRLPLRGTQIAMDLIRAAALASIPLAWWLASVTAAQLFAVALVVGAASVFFDIGNAAMLPFLVPEAELTDRNSLTSAAEAVTNLAGPSLGGALVQTVGAAASIVVDVISYLISACLLRNVPRPPRTMPDATAETTIRSSIKEGWNFVAREPMMRAGLLDATAINFVCGALTALAPVFLVRTLDLSGFGVGVLFATEGVGSLIGAALTPSLTRRLGSGRIILIAALALPATLTLLPLARSGRSLAWFGLGNAAFAATVVVSSIGFRTYRQIRTPPELLPRVAATTRFVSWGVIPLGAITAGAAAAWFGPRDALWATCAAALTVPLVVLTSPIRSRRDLVES